MNVTKLRVPTDENGLVPAGTYFQRLAGALREANEARDAEEDRLARRAAAASSRRRKAPADHHAAL